MSGAANVARLCATLHVVRQSVSAVAPSENADSPVLLRTPGPGWPGDTELMLRVVVEEYARMGCDFESIMDIVRDPFYQAAHGLLQLYGEDVLRQWVIEILGRCGIMRTTTIDTAPPPDQVVRLNIPGTLPVGPGTLPVGETPEEMHSAANAASPGVTRRITTPAVRDFLALMKA